MITMPIPSAELYQSMVSASAKAAGNAMNCVQQGFLSCVTKVYNSLVTMKDAVVAGFHHLIERMIPSAAEAPASTPPVTTLNPISEADTRTFCQELIREMETDPAAINGMFRMSESTSISKFNRLLADPAAFLETFKNGKISNIEASFLIKNWLGQTLSENKFSPEERRALVANKDNEDEVNKIIENKFNSSAANMQTNKNKFMLILPVIRKYKEISSQNINVDGRQHDPCVVGIVIAPQLFDLDSNLKQSVSEACIAFTALLDHCPPCVPPRTVSMRPN